MDGEAERKETPVGGGAGIPWLSSPALALALIAAAGILVYSNTFHASFHFDDAPNIVSNREVRGLESFWPPTGTRYLAFLSFALNYHFGKLDVLGYHLVNTSVHILNGLLVWWLVVLTLGTPAMRRAGVDRRAGYLLALVAALVFIVHPVQTQAVTYISQRFTSLLALFYLLGLCLYARARLSWTEKEKSRGGGGGGGAWAFYILALLAALAAMKTKETSFTMPFVILLYELAFFRDLKGIWPSVRRVVPFLLLLPVVPLTLFAPELGLREGGDGIDEGIRIQQIKDLGALSPYAYLMTQMRVVVTYLRLLVLPINQNLDYDYPVYHSLFIPEVFLSFLFLLSVLIFGVYLLIRSRITHHAHGLLASFGILWFFITLSVESSIFPIKDVINEHRLYLPSVGAAVAFSAAVFYCFDRMGIRKLSAATCVLLLLTAAPLGAAARLRNLVWENDSALWEDVVRKSPEKARGYNNLGSSYLDSGRTEEGLEEFKRAVELKPDFPEAYNGFGVIYSELGRPEEAIVALKRAVELRPDYPKAYNNLGVAYDELGRTGEAIAAYKKALLIYSYYPEALNNLGTAYEKMGRVDDAIREYEEALKLAPGNAAAHNNLGGAYVKKGRYDRAVGHYLLSLAEEPDSEEVHFHLGLAYYNAGRMEEAVGEFRAASRLKPDYADARYNLGLAYYNLGRVDEAIEEYLAALEFTPPEAAAKEADTHYNLGLAYRRKGFRGKAAAEFEEVLRVTPDDKDARGLLEGLRKGGKGGKGED
ncbi:MAG: tetratricopeptide repeat protein [Thermodesulfobacteriota bacterium]